MSRSGEWTVHDSHHITVRNVRNMSQTMWKYYACVRHTFPSTQCSNKQYVYFAGHMYTNKTIRRLHIRWTTKQNMSSDHSTKRETFGPISLHYKGQINSVSYPHFSRPVTSEPSDTISRYHIWPSPWQGQEISAFSTNRHDQLSGPPSLQWAPRLLPVGKVDGAWWWPLTSCYSRT